MLTFLLERHGPERFLRAMRCLGIRNYEFEIVLRDLYNCMSQVVAVITLVLDKMQGRYQGRNRNGVCKTADFSQFNCLGKECDAQGTKYIPVVLSDLGNVACKQGFGDKVPTGRSREVD